MYYLKYGNRPISGVYIQGTGEHRVIDFDFDEKNPMYFQYKEEAYALLVALSFCGEEVLEFKICYTEYALED